MIRRPSEQMTVTRVSGVGRGREVQRRPDELIVEEPLSIQLDGTLVSTTMRTPGPRSRACRRLLLHRGSARRRVGARRAALLRRRRAGVGVQRRHGRHRGRSHRPRRLGSATSRRAADGAAASRLDEMCARLDPLPDGGADRPRRDRLDRRRRVRRTGSVRIDRVGPCGGSVRPVGHRAGHPRRRRAAQCRRQGDRGDGPRRAECRRCRQRASGCSSVVGRASRWSRRPGRRASPPSWRSSAPTALAVDAARRANLVLAGFVRGDEFNLYAPEHLP